MMFRQGSCVIPLVHLLYNGKGTLPNLMLSIGLYVESTALASTVQGIANRRVIALRILCPYDSAHTSLGNS